MTRPTLLLLALLLAGAATAAETPPRFDEATGDLELVWPPPPEQARIRFAGSITTPEDIGKKKAKPGFWESFLGFLRGPDIDEMFKPMSVTVDSKRRVIVADPAQKQLHIFDQASGNYEIIQDAGKTPLALPFAVAVDDRDNIYVADSEARKIYVLDPSGKYLRAMGGPEQLERPTSIAVNSARRLLYVTDPPAHNIKIFNLDDGTLHTTFGKRGKLDGEFNFPIYIALDRTGQLYVTDTLNGRIQFFDPEGGFAGTFGAFGDGSGDFSSPKGLAVDSEGHIYVADTGFDNVQIFDQQGRLLLFFGRSGQAPGEFWMPAGMYMAPDDHLYVADSYNKRIQIFRYLKTDPAQ